MVCVGECLTPEVVAALVDARRPFSARVCHRCETGGACGDETGCDLTPEFLAEMRRAAETLDTLTRIYVGGPVQFSAYYLRYEAAYLERAKAKPCG